MREWLYAVAFATTGGTLRRKASPSHGLRGLNWKDQESSVKSNLFAVAVAARDDALVSGDQGRVLRTKNGGQTWEAQPTITSLPLFSVAYRGGTDAWVAGRGGAILRRTSAVATVKFHVPRSRRSCAAARPSFSRMKLLSSSMTGDIPRAVPSEQPKTVAVTRRKKSG